MVGDSRMEKQMLHGNTVSLHNYRAIDSMIAHFTVFYARNVVHNSNAIVNMQFTGTNRFSLFV